MNNKYADGHFFFVPFGCCIPTDSYAWIIVTLFIFFVLVLLFCIFATATVRWMYKRRMRKRLFDLKTRFINDQHAAQEYDVKLNIVAQKNSTIKNNYIKSKEDVRGPTAVIVNQAKTYATSSNVPPMQNPNNMNNAQVKSPRDIETGTPLAQSTLASISTTHISSNLNEVPVEVPKPPPPPKAAAIPAAAPPPPPPPPKKAAQVEAKPAVSTPPRTSPVLAVEVPPTTAPSAPPPPINTSERRRKLDPPTTTTTTNTTISSLNALSPGMRPFDAHKLRISSLSSSTKSAPKDTPPPPPPTNQHPQQQPQPPPATSSQPKSETEERENAGSDMWRRLITPPSRSWLFDSTGSNIRMSDEETSPGKAAASQKSSTLFKTDSSLYTTASTSQKFGHGAFVFEKK